MNLISRFLSKLNRGLYVLLRKGEYAATGTLRENEIIGAIANIISSNVGKLYPQVIRKTIDGMTVKNDHLSRLLNIRPCPETSTYDFLYKMASDLVYNSNAFAIIFYNNDYTDIQSIQPVTALDYRIYEESGITYLRFKWEYDQKEYTVPYQFVIHIKARYNKKRFIGTSPDSELQQSTSLLETTYDGIRNIISNSASLRGYLKYNNLINEKELRKKVDEFKSAYMSASNDGGVAGIDNAMEFHEITQKPTSIPTMQVSFFRENIYRYYGVNEKILNSTYTEAEWNAFYEAVIEPIALQLSLEFTFKVFTERERGFGNKIIFVPNRLMYATLQTRSAIANASFDRGAITINEYRELLYLSHIEDGDVRMVSLNYVKADEQSLYQTGKENESETQGSEAKNQGNTVAFIKSKIREEEENEST